MDFQRISVEFNFLHLKKCFSFSDKIDKGSSLFSFNKKFLIKRWVEPNHIFFFLFFLISCGGVLMFFVYEYKLILNIELVYFF